MRICHACFQPGLGDKGLREDVFKGREAHCGRVGGLGVEADLASVVYQSFIRIITHQRHKTGQQTNVQQSLQSKNRKYEHFCPPLGHKMKNQAPVKTLRSRPKLSSRLGLCGRQTETSFYCLSPSPPLLHCRQQSIIATLVTPGPSGGRRNKDPLIESWS